MSPGVQSNRLRVHVTGSANTASVSDTDMKLFKQMISCKNMEEQNHDAWFPSASCFATVLGGTSVDTEHFDMKPGIFPLHNLYFK